MEKFMNSRSGLSFADVLIILAVVLLLAALAVPKFIKAPDYGNEEDSILTNETSAAADTDSTNQTA
jgi:competence protein ComGC